MTGNEGQARHARRREQQSLLASPAHLEWLEERRLLSNYYVSPTGSNTASGSLGAPWQTVQYALDHASSGDSIFLRAGTYAGNLWINTPNLTISAYDGESARIASPYSDPKILVAVHINTDANNTHLVGLDISGGNYYAVKTESTWDTGLPNPHGPSGLLLQNCLLHDSGADVVKLTPATNNVTISYCEIYSSGRVQPTNAEGVDGVQVNYVTISDSYIHDIATNGIYLKGGSIGSLIERNRVYRCGYSGILLGQSTDPEWFDTQADPQYYESIDGIVRNNIVVSTVGAGIGAWAALRPQIYNNSLYDVAQSWFGGLLVQGQEHWVPQDLVTPSRDVTIYNNIVVVKSSRPELEIRDSGLAGTLTIGNNLYFNPTGAVFIRDYTRSYQGSLSGWQALGLDAGSMQADPQLDFAHEYQTLSSSPAIDAGRTAPISVDFARNPRPEGTAYDIGAYEFQPTAATLTAPSNLLAVEMGPNTVNLSWTNNTASATELTLQASTDPTFTYDLRTLNLAPSATSYSTQSLISGAMWYFRLQAATSSAVSAWDTASVQTYGIPAVPMQPGDPVLSTGAGGTVSVTWAASPANPYGTATTSYLIERAANSDFSSAVVRFSVAGNQLSHTDGQVLASATYYYRIRGVNSYGWSTASGAGNITTSESAPPPSIAAPASASPTVVTDSTANLSVLGGDTGGEPSLTYTWGIVAKPFLAPDPVFSSNGTNSAKSTVATFRYLGSYTLKVTISDATGLTVMSTINVQVVGVTLAIPQPPQNLLATAAGAQQVALTWTNPDNVATSFTVLQSTSPDFQYDLVTTQLPAGSSSYLASGLLTNVIYYFQVRANGYRLPSAWVQARALLA